MRNSCFSDFILPILPSSLLPTPYSRETKEFCTSPIWEMLYYYQVTLIDSIAVEEKVKTEQKPKTQIT